MLLERVYHKFHVGGAFGGIIDVRGQVTGEDGCLIL